MRTVAKAVFRSLSVSAVTDAVIMESQLRSDTTYSNKRKDITPSDNFSVPKSTASRDMCCLLGNQTKPGSLSPIYKLSNYEETSFVELQDKECDYYPDISSRGDTKILNLDLKNSINELNVNSSDIVSVLKNIRFINSFVFNQDVGIYLTTANYIQRLLHIKAIKKDLIQFISAAMYDIAHEQKVGKALTKDHVALLLSLTNIPVNHIEDFSRMKSLLLDHLNYDLDSMTLIDYLEIILKIKLTNVTATDTLPESHFHLIEIASILATSCEITRFTLACQAVSLINVAARHVSFDPSFYNQFSRVINIFPMIFVSPVRLYQFAKLDGIGDENIKFCAESMVRFFSLYYHRRSLTVAKKPKIRKEVISTDSNESLLTVIEEGDESMLNVQQTLDISELMDKLSKIKLKLHSQATGKQKQRHRRTKKKLARQLKKYDRSLMERVCYKPLTIDDDDSAISSSSNLTSPVNSPSSF